MRTRVLLAVVVVSCLLAPTFAEGPEKDKSAGNNEIQKDVEKLIEQLADEDFSVRDKAAKRLLEIGADGLPTLRNALNHSDAEVRRRLEDLVPTIETSAALSPKIVSLTAEKQTLKQIFDELSKQTGYKCEFFNNNQNQQYSFKFEKKPLWQVLDAIGDSTGLTIQQSYQEDVIRLQPQDAQVPYVCYDGPFRTVATGFQLIKNNNFGTLQRSNPTPSRSETLTLNLMVFAEPKTPMLSIGQASISTAYDENKVSMKPDDTDRNNPLASRSYYRNGGYKMFCTQATANLVLPADSSRTVKYIKGNIPVTLITAQKQELLTTEVLKAKGKQFTSGKITMSIENVTENPGGQVAIDMNVTNSDSKNDPNDYTWQNSIYQRLEVQDGEGNKFGHAGCSWGGSGPGQMHLTLRVMPPVGPKAAPAAKLLFQAWTTMQSAVTFEFKDLPLP